MFKNVSISVRFSMLFLLVLALIGSSYFLMLRNIYYNELLSQSRTISDNVMAFGSWVSQYGRVWVKDNDKSYLGKLAVVEVAAPAPADAAAVPVSAVATGPSVALDTDVKTAHFYSKNPALAQREFSEAVARSPAHAKFRMTSDNFMNPANKPDAFESSALEIVKAKKLKEYWALENGTYRYVRALYHEASCLACHSDAAVAPVDVITRYGGTAGFGFKLGDVAGVISVTMPAKPLWKTSLEVFGLVETALIFFAVILPFLFLRLAVIAPINKLTQAAIKISTGQPADLGIERVSPKTGNEIHHLAFGLERLRTSMQLAIQRMKSTNKPT